MRGFRDILRTSCKVNDATRWGLGSLWRHKDPQAPALKGTEKPILQAKKAYAFWLGSIKYNKGLQDVVNEPIRDALLRPIKRLNGLRKL